MSVGTTTNLSKSRRSVNYGTHDGITKDLRVTAYDNASAMWDAEDPLGSPTEITTLHAQNGVRAIEAITHTWTAPSLVIAYVG